MPCFVNSATWVEVNSLALLWWNGYIPKGSQPDTRVLWESPLGTQSWDCGLQVALCNWGAWCSPQVAQAQAPVAQRPLLWCKSSGGLRCAPVTFPAAPLFLSTQLAWCLLERRHSPFMFQARAVINYCQKLHTRRSRRDSQPQPGARVLPQAWPSCLAHLLLIPLIFIHLLCSTKSDIKGVKRTSSVTFHFLKFRADKALLFELS